MKVKEGKLFNFKRQPKHCEYSAISPLSPKFNCVIGGGMTWYPFLTTDQKPFLPSLWIEVQNTGETLSRARVTVEIAETSAVQTFSVYPGPFQGIKHFELGEFQSKKLKKLRLKVASKFLKPASYMIRVMVWNFEPCPSMLDQLKETFFGNGNSSLDQIKNFNSAVEMIKKTQPTLDFNEAPKNQFRGVLIYDWRLHELLKVHSIAGPAGVTAIIALPAAALAIGTVFVAIGKFCVENWDTIVDALQKFLPNW